MCFLEYRRWPGQTAASSPVSNDSSEVKTHFFLLYFWKGANSIFEGEAVLKCPQLNAWQCLAVAVWGLHPLFPVILLKRSSTKSKQPLGMQGLVIGLTRPWCRTYLTHYSGWEQFKCRSGCLCVRYCRSRSAVSWSCCTSNTSPGQQSERLWDTSCSCEEVPVSTVTQVLWEIIYLCCAGMLWLIHHMWSSSRYPKAQGLLSHAWEMLHPLSDSDCGLCLHWKFSFGNICLPIPALQSWRGIV